MGLRREARTHVIAGLSGASKSGTSLGPELIVRCKEPLLKRNPVEDRNAACVGPRTKVFQSDPDTEYASGNPDLAAEPIASFRGVQDVLRVLRPCFDFGGGEVTFRRVVDGNGACVRHSACVGHEILPWDSYGQRVVHGGPQ